jgi:uncharacterized protein YprB with RNaseH-like and TPR domain
LGTLNLEYDLDEMDINKRLKLYKKNNNVSDHTRNISEISLKLLQQHFEGEVIVENNPILLIRKKYEPSYLPFQLKIPFLSKNKFIHKINLNDIFFFDLETTGLSGGSGTFAFLLGFGFVEKNQLIVEQYFLPDYGREDALFDILLKKINSKKNVISFNGKTYDWPLLKSRYILNRKKLPVELETNHIDLLHISRRIWRDSYQSCRLISLEENVLNRFRHGDISGANIPAAYFEYLKTGAVHKIIKVIEHNYYDIISMLDLLNLINKIEMNPVLLKDAKALTQLAKLAFQQKRKNILLDILEGFGNRLSLEQIYHLKYWLSLLYKAEMNDTEAVKLWVELQNSKQYHFVVLKELVMYYEHKNKNLKLALKLCNKAISQLELLQEFDRRRTIHTYLENFSHRKSRLLNQLQ